MIKYYLHNSLEVIGASGFIPEDIICQIPEELKDKKIKLIDQEEKMLVQKYDENNEPILDENEEPVFEEIVLRLYKIPVLDEEAQALYEAELINKEIEAAWENLRLKRNTLLSECDFTQLADAPFSAEKKQEYAEYRQILRDLPDNTLDPLNPIFPQKPS